MREIALTAAAKRAGVNYTTALRWVTSGRIGGRLHEGRWVVGDAELQRLIDARAVAGRRDA